MENLIHGNPDWFIDARFGMFIHFGLYSLPARHEWVQHNEKLSAAQYRKYFEHFNPDLLNPKEWAVTAKSAGMKYVVITAKHHEGFCLWDSAYTDYKVTNTPFERDLLREIIDAFRAEGLRVGLYYSLIDWHHPDFVIDNIYGPDRDLPEAERKAKNAKRDMCNYARYMRNQVTELLSNYGKIDLLWFDFSYSWHPETADDPEKGKGCRQWESEELLSTVRALQPEILINNRLDLPGSEDFSTPEQRLPASGELTKDGKTLIWEGCQTFSGAWGYHRDEQSWKSEKQCIDLLVNHVSRGGNLLMNAGPTGRGEFDGRVLNRLAAYASWMRYHARAIYHCTAAPEEYPPPADCRYTWNPAVNRLYLHLLNWPFKQLELPNLAGKIAYAQFLHDGSEVRIKSVIELENGKKDQAERNDAVLELPVIPIDTMVPVIELFLK